MTDSTSTQTSTEGSAQGQEPATQTEGQAATTGSQQTATETAQAKAEWDGKIESLPDGAQKIIRDLRTENAAKRTQSTEDQAAFRKVAAALGITLPDTEKPDADALTKQLTASQQAQRDTAVELAVFKAAGPLNANPQTLLDSRSFMTSLADVDPTDTQAITTAITNAITQDARFKAAQAAARSGGDLSGGTGEGAVTKEQFARMTPSEKNELYKTNLTLYRQLAGS